MTPSIRTFLLINLLLSVTLIISLAIIANLFLAHRDIQTHLNFELIQHAHQVESLFTDTSNKHFARIQAAIDTPLSKHLPNISSHTAYQNLKAIEHQTIFQIWSPKGKLLLHSQYASKKPMRKAIKPGLQNTWFDGRNWVTYTLIAPQSHLTVVVAQAATFRQALEDQLTQNSIYVMLLTYPFLGVLTWIIVSRGLAPLDRIRDQVKGRIASHLSPVQLETVPAEILPVINELNRLFQRLEQAFDREKRFAGDAAHELRTPLAAMKTQMQVALRAKTNEQRETALNKAMTGVDRSTHVVQQLLTLSRMVPEARVNEPEAIDLNDKAIEILSTLAPAATKKQISLDLQEHPEPVIIEGNNTSLTILFRNLVDNAIRYTPEHGKASISITKTDTCGIIAITDTGPGIPDELKTRVFERFFRVIGNKAPGSGLGLGIVHQIAQMHQAKVELLTPENNIGLKVQVTFPLLVEKES